MTNIHVQNFDSKFCHRTGIARSEGRGQGQRNKLCLAGLCPRESFHSKNSDKIKKYAMHIPPPYGKVAGRITTNTKVVDPAVTSNYTFRHKGGGVYQIQ